MGYILPVPHFQYIDYKERVLNETKAGYSSVNPVPKVSFDKILQDASNPEMSAEERRDKRRDDYEAFRVHMAQVSGKGIQLDRTV